MRTAKVRILFVRYLRNKTVEVIAVLGCSAINTTMVSIAYPKVGLLAMQARDNPLADEDQTVKPRNPSGRKGKEPVYNVNRLKGGNDTTYTLRRLARDNPELLDTVEVIAPLVISAVYLPNAVPSWYHVFRLSHLSKLKQTRSIRGGY